jgi:hypothetical protein
LPAAPTAWADFEHLRPYEMRNLDDYDTLFADWQDKLIIPFIGKTGEGKTLTLARLLGYDGPAEDIPDDHPLHPFIRNAVDDSLNPIIAYWKTVELQGRDVKVFLLDMPGIGNRAITPEGVFEEPNEDHQNRTPLPIDQYQRLLAPLMRSNALRMAVVIVRAPLTIHEAAYLDIFAGVKNLTLMYAYNVPAGYARNGRFVREFVESVQVAMKLNIITRYSAWVQEAVDHHDARDLAKAIDGVITPMKIIDPPLPVIFQEPPGRRMVEGSANIAKAVVEVAVGFIPVVGPAGLMVYHCQEGKYVSALVDGAFVVLDIATFGTASTIVKFLKPLKKLGKLGKFLAKSPVLVTKVTQQTVFNAVKPGVTHQ